MTVGKDWELKTLHKKRKERQVGKSSVQQETKVGRAWGAPMSQHSFPEQREGHLVSCCAPTKSEILPKSSQAKWLEEENLQYSEANIWTNKKFNKTSTHPFTKQCLLYEAQWDMRDVTANITLLTCGTSTRPNREIAKESKGETADFQKGYLETILLCLVLPEGKLAEQSE